MKIIIELEQEDMESVKIALDSAATKWKAEAEKEEDLQHKSNFLQLHYKYSKLSESFKSQYKQMMPTA